MLVNKGEKAMQMNLARRVALVLVAVGMALGTAAYAGGASATTRGSTLEPEGA